MITGIDLAHVVDGLLSDIYHEVAWGELWQRELREGSAFQWACFAALITQAEQRGWAASFPLLEYPYGAYTFTLRNQLPRQHGAQPGHSAVSTLPLAVRTHQSFIPRAVLEKDGRYHSVFLEGVPYHLLSLHTPAYYPDRPDIVLLPGRPTPGSPITVQERFIDYSFDLQGLDSLTVAGRLEVVNRPQPSLYHRSPREGALVVPSGIVECSVNKTARRAQEQLERYGGLFGAPGVSVPSILIAGRTVTLKGYRAAHVPLDQDLRVLQASLRQAADVTLDTFGLS